MLLNKEIRKLNVLKHLANKLGFTLSERVWTFALFEMFNHLYYSPNETVQLESLTGTEMLENSITFYLHHILIQYQNKPDP